MMFGFAGAHRTGKTTVAKMVAENLGIHFHNGSVGLLMKKLGYDSVSNMDLDTRMKAQEETLDLFIKEISEAPRPCITDRTPIDMMAYMLAEVGMHNTNEEIAKRVDAYRKKALHATRTFFDTIQIIRPLPGVYVEEVGKPPINDAYQWHIQYLIEGAIRDAGEITTYAVIWTDDKEERAYYCAEFITDRLAQIHNDIKEQRLH